MDHQLFINADCFENAIDQFKNILRNDISTVNIIYVISRTNQINRYYIYYSYNVPISNIEIINFLCNENIRNIILDNECIAAFATIDISTTVIDDRIPDLQICDIKNWIIQSCLT